MIWSSVNEFIAMGGYGLYVWGAFGVTFAVMIGEMVSLRARRTALRRARSPVEEQSHDQRGFRRTPREA